MQGYNFCFWPFLVIGHETFLNISLPPGRELIVRSVGGPDRKEDPVQVIMAAVQTIAKTNKELADIPVVIQIPFPYVVLDGPPCAIFVSTLSLN